MLGLSARPMLAYVGHMLDTSGLCWAYVGSILGLCWAGTATDIAVFLGTALCACGSGGPLLGLCWSMLAMCWSYWSHVGSMLPLCWKNGISRHRALCMWLWRASAGPMLVYVGHMLGLLEPCEAYVASMLGLRRPLLGLCWPMLGVCWTYLVHTGGASNKKGGKWGPNMNTWKICVVAPPEVCW